jgi:WD40 repeat protein
MVLRLENPSVGQPAGFRYHPDGSLALLSMPDGVSTMFDTSTWDPIEGHPATGYDIAIAYWSQDGSLVASASSTGQVTIRDGETFEPVQEMVGATGISNVFGEGALLLSPDESTLLTNHDGVARLWDVESGQRIGVDFPTDADTLNGINVLDDLQLATITEGVAQVWNLDTSSWPDLACQIAGSSTLSDDEWAQWGPRDQDRYDICP